MSVIKEFNLHDANSDLYYGLVQGKFLYMYYFIYVENNVLYILRTVLYICPSDQTFVQILPILNDFLIIWSMNYFKKDINISQYDYEFTRVYSFYLKTISFCFVIMGRRY